METIGVGLIGSGFMGKAHSLAYAAMPMFFWPAPAMPVRKVLAEANDDLASTAAKRFGFTAEGTFRQHLVVKGQNRDTAWFSIIDKEWANCRKAFEQWLDPANFDAEGRQIRRLEELRD